KKQISQFTTATVLAGTAWVLVQPGGPGTPYRKASLAQILDLGMTYGGGALNLSGDLTVNVNKFTVAATTGNTAIARTASVAGLASVNAGANVTAPLRVAQAGVTITGMPSVLGQIQVGAAVGATPSIDMAGQGQGAEYSGRRANTSYGSPSALAADNFIVGM